MNFQNFLLKFKKNRSKILEDLIVPSFSSSTVVKIETSSKKM